MNFLSNRKCYLSGPIQYDVTGLNWRVSPKKILLEEFKIDVFDPFDDPKQQWSYQLKEAREKKDLETISKVAHNFVRKDLTMVDRCDFVIAYIPLKVPTTGTVHEIINSNNAKKPTLLVTNTGDKTDIPLWYYGFIPHECMFGSWEDLYVYLREVNDKKHINNRRWNYIYNLI